MLGILIATLGGTAVGLERQWSGHADGPSARFGGIRTFTMLGGVSGLCGWLLTLGRTKPRLVLLAGATAIIVAAYAAASRQDIDATTEVAALVVVAAGVLAGLGSFRLASGIIALLSLLLVEKSRLHSTVARIDDVSLRAAVRFGVMALVVLPLLPSGPYGPLGGIRPRELWALVLFFSGLSFLDTSPAALSGLDTATSPPGSSAGWCRRRTSRSPSRGRAACHPALARQLAFGAIAANAMLFPRVLDRHRCFERPARSLLVPYFLVPALVAAGVAALGARSAPLLESDDDARSNPLQLLEALRMAALFQLVLMAVHLANQTWGDTGVLTTAALLGLTDVDALTMSMARGMSERHLASSSLRARLRLASPPIPP